MVHFYPSSCWAISLPLIIWACTISSTMADANARYAVMCERFNFNDDDCQYVSTVVDAQIQACASTSTRGKYNGSPRWNSTYGNFSSYWDEIFLIVNEKPEVIVVWLLVSGKNISSLACTAHHVMHNNSVTLLTASHGHEDENGTISCKTVRYLPFLQPSSSTSGVLFQA